jgi:predicted AlkP superfamily phosphohydrolase/phosphomutase
MTYNFDPDRWYENELLVVRSKYKTGQITKQEYNKAVKELDRKLEDMWERLDGSYQLP